MFDLSIDASTLTKHDSHGDVKYSAGNIVNNRVITRHGARWALGLWGQGGHVLNYINV